MIDDRLPALISLGAWLALVVAGLARQQLGVRRVARLGLLWLVIILTAWAIVALSHHHDIHFT